MEYVRRLESDIAGLLEQQKEYIIKGNPEEEDESGEIFDNRKKSIKDRLLNIGISNPVLSVVSHAGYKATYSGVTEEVARMLFTKSFPGRKIKSVIPIELGKLKSI